LVQPYGEIHYNLTTFQLFICSSFTADI